VLRRSAAQQHQGASDSQGAQRAAAEAGDRDARPGQVHMPEEVDHLTVCIDFDHACCPLVRGAKHRRVLYGGVCEVLARWQQGPRRAVATTVGRGREVGVFVLVWLAVIL
jgi:hypothetical protein